MSDFNDTDFGFEVDFQSRQVEKPVPPERGHELGLFEGISNAEYHGGPGISSSQLKYAAKALRLYKASIDGELERGEDTDDTILGSVAHTLVLQPELLHAEYSIRPADLKKPTVAQLGAKKPSAKSVAQMQRWDRFCEESKGKTVITQDMHDRACRIRDAVYAHPEAAGILVGGQAELSGYYLDQDFRRGGATHMLCRYRPDYRTDDFLVDLKTCVDASKDGFMRTIGKFGYHVSASHYLAGDAALKGTDHKQFIFIAVEKKSPFLVGVYVLSQRDLELGDWIRRKALNAIKKARQEKLWPGYNDDLAAETELPPYLFYDFERDRI